EYLNAGHRAWHFIESTYQVTDALYISQLEEQLSHIRMGEEETATDYCNWARKILATMRMAGVQYSTASYLMHVIKGLTSSYNLLKRLSLVPSTRATLNEDSLTSYILQDEAMQEAKRPSKPLAQVNYVALAMAAAVQANVAVVLLDSGCSHHLMGTKEVFVDLEPSGDVKNVRGFNGALQDVQVRGTVALQGEAERQVLIPDVLYVPGVRANLLSAGQLKENGVKLQEDGDGMLLVSAAGDILGRASYTGSEKHEVATGSDLKSANGADLPCVSCVDGKLAQHTFPDQGFDADDVLAIVHVDLSERHGGARDEDVGGVGANDAAAHGRAAPLVAPRSAAGRLGPQLPRAIDAAAGDDAIPAANREEARLVAGTGMGLHGAVLGPRAAAWWKAIAEGHVEPSRRHFEGEQALGAPRHRRQPGSHHVGRGVQREHVARGVDVIAQASVGPDADHPADGDLDGDTPSARRG
ncbi:unnamed protein product, partial [Closterium sp. NIES-54]